MAAPPNEPMTALEAWDQVDMELAHDQANLADSLAAAPDKQAWLVHFRACIESAIRGPEPAAGM